MKQKILSKSESRKLTEQKKRNEYIFLTFFESRKENIDIRIYLLTPRKRKPIEIWIVQGTKNCMHLSKD